MKEKCPRCGHHVEIEYDIWNNSYWACYHCGLLSHQLVSYSGDTTATSYIMVTYPWLSPIKEWIMFSWLHHKEPWTHKWIWQYITWGDFLKVLVGRGFLTKEEAEKSLGRPFEE